MPLKNGSIVQEKKPYSVHPQNPSDNMSKFKRINIIIVSKLFPIDSIQFVSSEPTKLLTKMVMFITVKGLS